MKTSMIAGTTNKMPSNPHYQSFSIFLLFGFVVWAILYKLMLQITYILQMTLAVMVGVSAILAIIVLALARSLIGRGHIIPFF